jgi:anti-sigma factor RsiW
MDCHDAQTEMTAYLSGDLAAEDLRAVEGHMASCAGCRAELAVLRQTWGALGDLPTPSLAPGIDRRILQRVATEVAETPPPPIPSVRWRGVGMAALVAVILSIGNSLILPYEVAFQWCSQTIRRYPLLADLSDGTVFFGIGIFYGLAPLFLAGLLSGRLLGARPLFHGAVTSSAFALVIVPYVLVACSGLPELFTLCLVVGILVGALSGGVGGFWAGGYRLRPAY